MYGHFLLFIKLNVPLFKLQDYVTVFNWYKTEVCGKSSVDEGRYTHYVDFELIETISF